MTWKISETMKQTGISKARKSKTNDWANCFMTYPCCYGSSQLYFTLFHSLTSSFRTLGTTSSLSSEQKIIREWGVLPRNYIKTLLSKVIMMEKASIHFCCFIFQQKVQTKPKTSTIRKKIWKKKLFLRRFQTNKGRSTLVPKVPKITARWRQMGFCIFCAKSRQNERSSALYSLNINKLSRFFSWFFFLCKIRLFWWNYQNAI